MESSYKTLNIPDNSNLSTVKSAYYKLAKQYHPDYNQGDENAEIKFRSINKAYAEINKLIRQNCTILGVNITADMAEINRAFNILHDKHSKALKQGRKAAQHDLDTVQKAYDFLNNKIDHNATQTDTDDGW